MSATVVPDGQHVDARVPDLVIEPGATKLGRYIRDMVHHRYLIQILGTRELKLRYRQTLLGPVWIVLQPIISAGILSFVFGSIAELPTEGVPTFLFTYTGMLAWNAFSTSLNRSGTVVVNNAPLVSKVFFPRLVLPISTMFGASVDFAVTLVLVLGVAWWGGYPPRAGLLLMPIWLVFELLLAVGIGTVLGSLAVRYRDVVQLSGIISQFLMYASPVAYAVSAVPERYRGIYYLNPMVSLIEGVRWSMLGTPFPTAQHLGYSMVVAVLMFCGAFIFMERMEPRFADVI